MRQLRYTFFILTLFLMLLIFLFSSQPADRSTQLSNSVGYTIGTIFVEHFEEMEPEVQEIYVESIDHAVRKCAHGSEFLLLAVFSTATLLSFRKRRRASWRFFFFGWLIAVLYAVSDEVHQIFVPGRACLAMDVLIDASGAFVGALLFFFIFRIASRSRK